jgi:hypothetical protein
LTSSTSYYLKAVFALLLCTGVYAGTPDARRTALDFFANINERSYAKAYAFFSGAIKQEISFSQFREKARDIKKARIIALTVYDEDRYLVKMRVKAKITMIYKGDCYEALYGGTCNLQRDEGPWKVASVELKPLEQKKVPGNRPINFKSQSH